eukprot:CAMPEP_0179145234 /NCGR_PEP_ID=MMETSP0796-20121207/70048_1 /TAXON_ID=73915 /ORGANISM="Pyrodinium bahamense, Strain pbaha01" /LENGTH=90 /DNA_ID=CAMNT_0020845585 /DNA_START=79 /DNA_END=351 /DNA_ORIENTATION=-
MALFTASRIAKTPVSELPSEAQAAAPADRPPTKGTITRSSVHATTCATALPWGYWSGSAFRKSTQFIPQPWSATRKNCAEAASASPSGRA